MVLARSEDSSVRFAWCLGVACAAHIFLLFIVTESNRPKEKISLELTLSAIQIQTVDAKPEQVTSPVVVDTKPEQVVSPAVMDIDRAEMEVDHQAQGDEVATQPLPRKPEPLPASPLEQKTTQINSQLDNDLIEDLAQDGVANEGLNESLEEFPSFIIPEVAAEQSRAVSFGQNESSLRIKRLKVDQTDNIVEYYYLLSWQRKIQSVGRLNYPAEAKRLKLKGVLQLLTSIRYDGELIEVKILGSSGHQILDDAAVKIIYLAAPFNAFPPNIRKQTDVLEIVHDWQFR